MANSITKWNFDDATFNRSAASLKTRIMLLFIHNYRWRLGLAEGEAKYDELEKRLAESPVITAPTITMEGMQMVHLILTRVLMPKNFPENILIKLLAEG
jgi:hypothetical protein